MFIGACFPDACATWYGLICIKVSFDAALEILAFHQQQL